MKHKLNAYAATEVAVCRVVEEEEDIIICLKRTYNHPPVEIAHTTTTFSIFFFLYFKTNNKQTVELVSRFRLYNRPHLLILKRQPPPYQSCQV